MQGGQEGGCPEPEVLAAFSRGRLDAESRLAVEAHFDACASGASVVADLVRIYATEAATVASAVGPESDRAAPGRVDDDDSRPAR